MKKILVLASNLGLRRATNQQNLTRPMINSDDDTFRGEAADKTLKRKGRLPLKLPLKSPLKHWMRERSAISDMEPFMNHPS